MLTCRRSIWSVIQWVKIEVLYEPGETGWRTSSRAFIRGDTESACLSVCLSARWMSILRFIAYILLAHTLFAANIAGGPCGMPDCAVLDVKPAVSNEQRLPKLAGSHRARRAERARVQLVSNGEATQSTGSSYGATCTTASTRYKTHVRHSGMLFSWMDGATGSCLMFDQQ